MSGPPDTGKRLGKCNGYGHPSDCICGWGGVYHTAALSGSGTGSIPPAGTRAVWQYSDYCRPSTCPKCRRPVFFVRHNGGSVWFDALGQPWPKHPCMATEPDMRWLQKGIPGGIEPSHRQVFGVIQEARVVDPGVSAFFVIYCSDGTIVEDEFVYSLNPCENVGGLVALELSPDNKVGARRFKAVEDMLEAHKAMLTAKERQKRSLAKRRDTLAQQQREWNQMWDEIRYGRR